MMAFFCRTKLFYAHFSLLLIALFLASCSASQNLELSGVTEETLKSAAVLREQDVIWSRELEGSRLSKSLSEVSDISSSVPLSITSVSVAHNDSSAIYPELPGFASLDTSSLLSEHRNFLDTLCKGICSWSFDKNLFKSNFSAVIFSYDVKHFWQEVFSVPFPTETETLFSNFLYGKPEEQDGNVRVPVRFLCELGFVDADIFIIQTDKILAADIQLVKMGAKNAE